ncbi:hypothetical protein KM043_018434 [Ampulex compressa]|nr:hypothetical protein KM043_018434 [Ampulex compressa]
MKLIGILCLLLFLGACSCQKNDLPSRIEVERSINRTVSEVERMLRENASLPRLSRKEIVGILFNITSKELESYEDKEVLEKARNMYQRALMVVLPYNAKDSPDTLKDLYTKAPMVHLISDSGNLNNRGHGFDQKVAGIDLTATKESKNSDYETQSPTENLVLSHASEKTIVKESQSTTVKNRYKNHRETYSEVYTKLPFKEALKLDSAPVKFSFNLSNLQKNPPTTESALTTKRPVFKEEGSKDQKLEIVYSTSVTVAPTTKTDSQEEVVVDLGNSKTNQNVLASSQWRYNAPPSTTQKVFVKPVDGPQEQRFPSTTDGTREEDGVKPPSITIEPFKKISGSTTEAVRYVDSDRPSPIYVTPMSTPQKSKYSSTYTSNSGGHRASSVNSTTSPVSMRQEVMDLLASIGLRPDNQSRVEEVFKKNKELSEVKFQIPDTNNLVHGTSSALSSTRSEITSIADQNTFEGHKSEIRKGVENLSPDVQLLFQRFGLQTSNLDPTTTTTQATTTGVNSYTNFKPLPTSVVKDEEMKEFLARFGLGVGDSRREKSMRISTQAPSVVESLPQNFKQVLEDIGLLAKPRGGNGIEQDMESTGTTKLHVFKPHEVSVEDEIQRSKINKLLDTVRMVQEGKADVQAVHKVASDLLERAKTLQAGPDPVSLEEILRMYNENLRNEVKRQEQRNEETETTTISTEDQANSSPASTGIKKVMIFVLGASQFWVGRLMRGLTQIRKPVETFSTSVAPMDSEKALSDVKTSLAISDSLDSVETTTTTTTTTGAASNLLALEESFGGGTPEPDPVLPTRPKSGLYFLVDWNTFLEVGEDEGEKVNLRFQPKVGDRTRFLPVKVP